MKPSFFRREIILTRQFFDSIIPLSLARVRELIPVVHVPVPKAPGVVELWGIRIEKGQSFLPAPFLKK